MVRIKTLLNCAGVAGDEASGVQPDPEIVTQLMGMGFSENGSKRAAVATKASPSTVPGWLAVRSDHVCWVSQ